MSVLNCYGDVLLKNTFGFEMTTVMVNDSVTKEANTKNQMRKFLKFVHDDNVYYKYNDVVYILFHTWMRISEFCELTLCDIDLENKVINSIICIRHYSILQKGFTHLIFYGE